QAVAKALRDEAPRACSGLGVPMASDKTEGPTTRLTSLGTELDTVAMTATLPLPKRTELSNCQLTSDWQQLFFNFCTVHGTTFFKHENGETACSIAGTCWMMSNTVYCVAVVCARCKTLKKKEQNFEVSKF
ncbi:MAG: hypothetical protein P4M11_04205, partial [Candidatus Pacebacteria bacterium]|nr:hypothetical protein [Candidatus Paceibacterota bacterium]